MTNHAIERMREEFIKAMMRRPVIRRDGESELAEASRRGRLLQSEPQTSLSDVPLHKRGFGVMDDDVP